MNFQHNHFVFLQNLITEYNSIIKEVIFKEDGYNFSKKYQKVLFDFLERFYYLTSSILSITNKMDFDKQNNHYYLFPIGILNRTIITDILTAIYLISKLPESKDENFEDFEKELLRLNYYSLNKISKTWKLDSLETEQSKNILLNFYSHFPDCYNKTYDKVVLKTDIKHPPQVSQIKDKINNIDNMELKSFSNAYYIYVFYSQYEHFSEVSKGILYTDKSFEFKFFLDTIRYLLLCTSLILSILKLTDNKDRYNELFKNYLDLSKAVNNE